MRLPPQPLPISRLDDAVTRIEKLDVAFTSVAEKIEWQDRGESVLQFAALARELTDAAWRLRLALSVERGIQPALGADVEVAS